MTSTIELPLWFVIIAGFLALIAFVERLLTPAVRWFFRRRVNRAIEELNTRLKLKIRPFGLTKRRILVDRLAYDPEVVAAAEAYAEEEDMPLEVAMANAQRYASEIVPSFNAYAYFRVGTRLARAISTALYRVRLGYTNEEALAGVDPNATVIFVMNHRSNMDYVLVTYLASASTALSYAVGEWARVAILQHLIRSMGAYFIRRNARNVLYRRVLARYVAMATEAGVTQAVFPEGGLSRDGKLRPVKLGLLSYILNGYDPEGRDIVFIPVGLNYDRVLEDRTLIAEIDGKSERVSGSTKFKRTMGFIWKNFKLRLAGRWHRFGYACVSFGSPVSMKAELKQRRIKNPVNLSQKRRANLVEAIGGDLMVAVGDVVPVLPVSVVSTVLQDAGGSGMNLLSIKAAAGRLMDDLVAGGAHVHIPHADHDYAVEAGLRMLVLRHVVEMDDEGNYRVADGEDSLVAYYANAIAHLENGTKPKLR